MIRRDNHILRRNEPGVMHVWIAPERGVWRIGGSQDALCLLDQRRGVIRVAPRCLFHCASQLDCADGDLAIIKIIGST